MSLIVPAMRSSFPAGLRVVAVDDDPAFLKILGKMLNNCSYEVTTFCLARDALNMLRDRKDGFDILITDVNMPDMDGFQLLEHVRAEMDLPVIMMSVDGEASRVMKGIQKGACDFLLKPIRMEELKNIWQHVIREKMRNGDHIHVTTSRSDGSYDGQQQNAGATTANRKRKEMENKRHEQQESVDPSTRKRTRVVWSIELHRMFVVATSQLGFDKAKPKKILDLMNVCELSEESVASHLQKYRFYLSKLRKKNEVQNFEGKKELGFCHPAGSLGFQNPVLMHPKDAANYDLKDRDNNMLLIETGTTIYHEAGRMATPSLFPVGLTKTSASNFIDGWRTNDTSQTILPHPFNYQSSQSNTTTQSWSEIPMERFNQPPHQDPEPYALLDDDFSHALQSASQNLIQVAPQCSAYSVSMGNSVAEKEKPESVMIAPWCSQSRSDHGHTINPETSDVISSFNVGMQNQMVSMDCLNDCEPTQQNLYAVDDSFLGSVVGCAPTETIGMEDVGLFDYRVAEIFAEFEKTLYCDDLGF